MGKLPLPDIDVQVPPRQWTRGFLTTALTLKDDEFNTIFEAIQTWLNTSFPDGVKLSTTKNRNTAREYAENALRTQYADVFNRIEQDTPLWQSCPYGFVCFAVERLKSRTPKASQSPAASTTPIRKVPISSPPVIVTPIRKRPISSPPAIVDLTSPKGQLAMDTFVSVRRPTIDEETFPVSLESFTTIDESTTVKAAINTASLDRFRTVLLEQELTTTESEHDAVVAQFDPRPGPPRGLKKDTNLREAMRVMFAKGGADKILFNLYPGKLVFVCLCWVMR